MLLSCTSRLAASTSVTPVLATLTPVATARQLSPCVPSPFAGPSLNSSIRSASSSAPLSQRYPPFQPGLLGSVRSSSVRLSGSLGSTLQTRTMASIPKTMRAVQIKDGTGPSSALYIGETEVPQLEDDQVLVKIEAFGLNRMDLLQREGHYPLPPGASPILGVEFSGTVVATKNTKTSWKEGQAVFGLATGGAYAEYIRVPSSMVLEKPAEFDWVQAAAIPENFLTAFQALRVLSEMKAGEDVLVHAGASGVGLAAIQLARAFGANNIYTTAGSDDKIRFCEQIGATKGFNYKALDWADELAKETGAKPGAGSVDVIMDFVGAPYFSKNLDSLKRDGRLVLQGFMGGSKVKELNIGPLLFKRLRVEGSTLRSRSLEYQGDLVQGFVREKGLERLINGCAGEGDGHHKLVIHKVYSWKDIKDAHDEMAANKNIGKIVVTVD